MLIIAAFFTASIVGAVLAHAARDRCPQHSDAFDLLTCDLCFIKTSRQSEISAFASRFEHGHNGSMFPIQESV